MIGNIAKCETGSARLSASAPTITEQLKQEKVVLEERLAKVNEALTALQANPEVEKILNLISKVNRY